MSTHSPQPDPGGDAGRPGAYLTTRLLLAVAGVGASALVTALLLRADVPVLGWVTLGLASIAVVDLIAVHRRRRTSRRLSQDRHGTAGSAPYRR